MKTEKERERKRTYIEGEFEEMQYEKRKRDRKI